MAKLELLNRELHKDLRVSTQYRSGLGYDVGAVMVLPYELSEVQRELPILFRKHPETGQLFPNALLGFELHENLLLNDNGEWNGNYIPLSFAKGPFVIAPQQINEKGDMKPVIAVDLEDPRVAEGDGEPIFEESGEITESMDKMRQALMNMHESHEELRTMVDAFLEADLIEPLKLEVTFNNGKDISFEGAYTITYEKLQELSEEQLIKLNKSGFLSAAYFIASSLNNVRRLIDIKNSKPSSGMSH